MTELLIPTNSIPSNYTYQPETEADKLKPFSVNIEVGSLDTSIHNDTFFVDGGKSLFCAFTDEHGQPPHNFNQKMEQMLEELPVTMEPSYARQKLWDIYSSSNKMIHEKTYGFFGLFYNTPKGETIMTIINCGGFIYLYHKSNHKREDLTHRSHPGFFDGKNLDHLPFVDVLPQPGSILLLTPNQIGEKTQQKLLKNLVQNEKSSPSLTSKTSAEIIRRHFVSQGKTKDSTVFVIGVDRTSNSFGENYIHKGYIVPPTEQLVPSYTPNNTFLHNEII